MASIEIVSARTTVRPFSPEDAPEVFACISPEITRFMAWEPPQTTADFAAVWQTWLPSIDDQSNLHMVARQRDDHACLGIVGLHDLQSGTPELGIWLRHDVHGMGLGRELIGAVATWASRNVPIKYFEYPVAEENVASRRIAEAYGGRIMERRTSPKYQSVVYHIPPFA
ncbi:GNAT family N-acetyltransferase [Rhizobium ruizarguesonis]